MPGICACACAFAKPYPSGREGGGGGGGVRSYLKTLASSWPRFLLSAVEQAIVSYAEKRQNDEIKPY